ncbi:hypothetical protein CERSUDRAFT_112375 [Gelatoporia subvermispora B]|uniref:Protein-S-isoprenylcysteine O-methyltransferase n=1 Tax=Ceriporiopsis subvermispora (strain B) TaxID=914234 RepID=M2R6C9_CERS8|nr:hypothetical protein CERSUDRAFT_112375 [Gelatoporia subvermispora B]
MPSPPLSKVALLAVAEVAHWITFQPPNTDVKNEETTKYAKMSTFTRARSPLFRQLHQIATATIMACEALTILASRYPKTFGNQLPSLLMRHAADASKLRITPAFLLGWLLVSGGGFIRWLCYRHLGRHFTFYLTVRDNHQLITSGPYSVVRHPAYTACIAVVIGSFMTLLGEGSWLRESGKLSTPMGKVLALLWAVDVLYVPTMMLKRVPREDEVLKKEFGDQWVAWSKRTPYRLIPGIY